MRISSKFRSGISASETMERLRADEMYVELSKSRGDDVGAVEYCGREKVGAHGRGLFVASVVE